MVLTSKTLRPLIEDRNIKVIEVDERTISDMEGLNDHTAFPLVEQEDTACILLTSRKSKHRSLSYSHGVLATACAGQGRLLQVYSSSRVMQLSSYSSDIALSEIFSTLVNGGCVCIPSPAERIADFSGAVARMKVNWTYLTPTLSRRLKSQDMPGLAVVCFRSRQLDVDCRKQ
ncbi:hypothetical protein F5Y17DRAFT_453121 [Xylariaceae sp. FL0594]|nr:hypothetical protein F5Y17DRAFT_453121 [Xylariaceae sp. FL0594]